MRHSLFGDLHPGGPTPDDVLVANLHHRVTTFIDESPDKESLVAYVVTANGRGRRLRAGPVPPQDQHEACVALARRLHDKVRPSKGFAWVVCLAGWLPATEDAPGRYDQVFMVPKDGAGDMPFVLDTDDSPRDMLAGLDNLADQCAEGVDLYRLHLDAADIGPEHMREHASGRHRDPKMVSAALIVPGELSRHRRPRVHRGFVPAELQARGRQRTTH